MRYAPLVLACCLVPILEASPLLANDTAVMVLHAVPSNPAAGCDRSGTDRLDCRRPANVSVRAGESIDVFLFLKDATNIAGAQVKFVWSPGWVFQAWFGSAGGCQANALEAVAPSRESGELAMAFDAVIGQSSPVPIGWLTMMAGAAGCLELHESQFPDGTHIINQSARDRFPIPPERRGKVCVGLGGVDGCNLGADLDDSSWGRIKNQYGR